MVPRSGLRGDEREIEHQIIGSALRAIAEEMGAVLIRSAFSANIKERRDCSTALFDERGRMIAQAEHIPVHLGAMPDAVAAVMRADPRPDDVFILNDPFTGGTHLPDITLVSRTALGSRPPRPPRRRRRRRAGQHAGPLAHARGGGSRDPADAARRRVLQALVARMRNPDERRGDFRAQLAAQRLAAWRVDELCERRGRDRVAAAMDELLRLLRAASSARDRARCPTAATRRATSSSRTTASSRSTRT